MIDITERFVSCLRRSSSKGAGRRRGWFAVCTALLMVAAGGAPAQQRETADRSVWDGVFTEAQVARAATTYTVSCAGCHGADLEGSQTGRPLTGDPFWQHFQGRTLDYMIDYVRTNMPNNAARGSLDIRTYLDLVALILSRNEFPAGSTELTVESGAGIQIVRADGAGELPASTLARVVGCLARAEAGWVVENASAPARVDAPGAAPEDATSLGERAFPLQFVFTPLDRFAGHRVWVRGLLLGEGGSEGINVSEVRSLGETCQ